MITWHQTVTYGIIFLLIGYTAGWLGFNIRNKEVRKLRRKVEELQEELSHPA